MIDIENEIFSPIATELREEFPGIYVTGRAENGIPQSLPCVVLSEIDNYTAKRQIDSSGIEKYVEITYKVDVFSNKSAGNKAECKAIMAAIADRLYGLNFHREANKPEEPLNNGKIFWQSARFVAKTDGEKLYRV